MAIMLHTTILFVLLHQAIIAQSSTLSAEQSITQPHDSPITQSSDSLITQSSDSLITQSHDSLITQSHDSPNTQSRPSGINSSGTIDSVLFLSIPERTASAMPGSALVEHLTGMSLEDRERVIIGEFLSGNVPSFSRKLRPVQRIQTIHGKEYELVFFSSCDYLAIGSDLDYLYVPLTPSTAQYLADTLGCMLPTRIMVDEIYASSDIKLTPQPIPPSDRMTSIPVFAQHTDSIRVQFALRGLDRSSPGIYAGHKKDIIISNEIYTPVRKEGSVVIYGWHLSENKPIQPVYSGHFARYADYSHGVRLISSKAYINGDQEYLRDILKDSLLSALLSREGIIRKPYYPQSKLLSE